MNKLKNALSPYLLQHQHNPVHWQEWDEPAFAEAKRRNIPIFLSIGYAACHWCHVMAHESFADEATANYLNQHFVCIKVDREERPDIDHIYMQALLQFTGQGGWPLTMFLTPDAKPFYGGTYFPKAPSYGQISFLELLQRVHAAWQTQQPQIDGTAAAIQHELTRIAVEDTEQKLPALEAAIKSYDNIADYLDFSEGGFKGAPKFPQVSVWLAIFMTGIYSNKAHLSDASYLTAEKLCRGGIYDHLGGGWARYSTDENWLVPHFEKMLYDNAQIIQLLTALYAYQPNPLFYDRIEETINWLQREMKLAEGAFAASLDADSEGEEGKYYCWEWEELAAVLGDDLQDFANFYGASPRGNWEGKNILHINHQIKSQLTNDQLQPLKEKLHIRRQQRIKPQRDEKILLDWNALIILALSNASLIFNKPAWLELAQEVYAALKNLLYDANGWKHAYRARKYQTKKLLEDYAYIIQAAIALYAASGQPIYLQDAENWIAQANKHFLHQTNGLYHQNSLLEPPLIANPQPLIDGALPGGNGMMAINLAQLHLITGRPVYLEGWEKLIKSVTKSLVSPHSWQLASLMQSLYWYYSGLNIKTDWQQQEVNAVRLPYWLLIQHAGMQELVCCNQTSCLAEIKSIAQLSNLVEKN